MAHYYFTFLDVYPVKFGYYYMLFTKIIRFISLSSVLFLLFCVRLLPPPVILIIPVILPAGSLQLRFV